MIKFPVTLKQMVFLKRLWEDLWAKVDTPNYPYGPLEVHSEKRQMLLLVQILFLDVFDLEEDPELVELRQNKLLELLAEDIVPGTIELPPSEISEDATLAEVQEQQEELAYVRDDKGRPKLIIQTVNEVRAEEDIGKGLVIIPNPKDPQFPSLPSKEELRRLRHKRLTEGSDFDREVC